MDSRAIKAGAWDSSNLAKRPDNQDQEIGAGQVPEQPPTKAEEALVARLTELLEPVVRSEGLILVELTFRPEQHGTVLRMYADRPEGGITLEECQGISRQVSDLLDVEDLVPESYHLEVSSPGLTRKLKSAREYDLFAGRLAKLIVRQPTGGTEKIIGVLKGLMGEDVLIDVKGKVRAVALEAVAKANLEIDF